MNRFSTLLNFNKVLKKLYCLKIQVKFTIKCNLMYAYRAPDFLRQCSLHRSNSAIKVERRLCAALLHAWHVNILLSTIRRINL